MKSRTLYSTLVLIALIAFITTGCSSPSKRIYDQRNMDQRVHVGDRQQAKKRVVQVAKSMLGVPYSYGGQSPETGFDCSGLVQYAHEQIGLEVPRTTGGQYKAVMTIPRRSLQPGDLVFFKTRYDRYITHVGIYLGEGRFIHAPSSGKTVSIASIRDRYWSRRFTAAGRFF